MSNTVLFKGEISDVLMVINCIKTLSCTLLVLVLVYQVSVSSYLMKIDMLSDI